MDNRFKVIMSAKEAKRIVEEYQEKAYQGCEKFLIDYVSCAIARAASEGKTSTRIFLNTHSLPTGMEAKKVLEYLASPLYQLGYECKLSGEFCFDILWGNKLGSRQDIVEDWEDAPF